MRVFITGASSGLGEALARLYAARGATLGLAARNGSVLESLSASIDAPCRIMSADTAARKVVLRCVSRPKSW